MTFEDSLAHAIQFHQQGRLDDARSYYLQSLATNPAQPNALNLLGVVERQLGRLEDSERSIRAAIAADPLDARFPFNLGETLRAMGKHEQAIEAYDRSLAIDPGDGRVWHARGTAAQRLGRDDEALGNFRRAAQEFPDLLPALQSLFTCATRQNLIDEAAAVSEAIFQLDSDSPAHLARQAAMLLAAGEHHAAAVAYQGAIAQRPANADWHIGLADCLDHLGMAREAEATARRAVALDPKSPRPLIFLAGWLDDQDRPAEAVAALRQALLIDPDHPLALGTLARLLSHRFAQQEGIAMLRRAIAAAPGAAILARSLPMMLNLVETDEQSLFEEHKTWAARHAAPLMPPAPARPIDPNPQRLLRVGYVSPDLRAHPVSYFLEPLLAGRNRDTVWPIVYCDARRTDQVTARFREEVGSDNWREVARLSDAQLARHIQEDRVDILVDLAGHTGDNRLMLFARGLCPVQVTYLGYPNTTGLPRSVMQYRITDAWCDPPGVTDELHTEELVRIADCFLCYRPPGDSPASLARAQDRPLTFGSFSAMMKITPWVVRLWSLVLLAVGGSRMLIKNKSVAAPDVSGPLLAAFAENGISADRIELLGQDASRADHLNRYNQIDIVLDTYPYHGTTTTCETLWMGTPMITLAGSAHRSRVGVSLLNNVGLGDLVAQSEEQYVQLAQRLAQNPSRRAELHQQLRARMTNSPLRDERAFVRKMEAAYRGMWERVCGG
ncbi:MAG TPA: tetratricopeptide repeat protein [Humisphaera sp.]|jgi:predicted O-linked N-acetylglucosamine transferase (SPINDLY family)|nr:tetratricopeptide repeat protein [Humisphaera sp.]